MNTVDMFLFMGQSNMAGRGIVTSEHSQGAPDLTVGAGYEYRAVSNPGRLYPIQEPFGCLENREGGIDDGDSHYLIRHQFMVWCQGESDGDIGKSGQQYCREFECMLEAMLNAGIEMCFLIRIGCYNGPGSQDYSEIMAVQDQIAQTNEHVVMVSRSFSKMKEQGLMKDDFHYFQEAYNIVGREAGENAACYVSGM